jgi:hypothetical protein
MFSVLVAHDLIGVNVELFRKLCQCSIVLK